MAAARYSTSVAPRAEPSSAPEVVSGTKRRRVVALDTAFPRAQRLLSSDDFSRVFSGAERSSDRFFTVLGRLNEFGFARLGLAISKKVAPRAVDRNRLRRLTRESFRQQQLTAIDYVVMARKDAVSAPNPALRGSLDRHFSRLSQRAEDR